MSLIVLTGYITEDECEYIDWYYHDVREHAKYGVLADSFIFASCEQSDNNHHSITCEVELFLNPSPERRVRRSLNEHVDLDQVRFFQDRIVVVLDWDASSREAQ
jgi:hypothetical protein